MQSVSGGAAYANTSDMLDFFNVRVLSYLLSDSIASAIGAGGQPGQVAGSSVLARHLASASGEVEWSIVKGGKYTPADLTLSTGNAKAELCRLVCVLAYASVVRRKYPSVPDADLPDLVEARKRLKMLAMGENFLPFAEVANAMQVEVLPTLRVESRITTRANRLFGTR